MEVQGDDEFAVGARGEGVVGGELGAEGVVVVEFAIDDGVDGAVGGGGVEGLGARRGEVVDGEADVA